MREDASAATDVRRAHWRRRIKEDGVERWIAVSGADDGARIARVLMTASTAALEDLENHASDEALRDERLAGSSPGLVETQRLLYLAVLLRDIGPDPQVPGVVATLRNRVSGTVHEGRIERQLGGLGLLPT
jgi:hypothetical protein